MAKIKFFQRTSNKKTELAPLYVRVVIGRSFDKTAKTGLFFNPDDWNPKQENLRDKATIKNRDEKNRKISGLRYFIEDAINNLPDKQDIPKDFLTISIDKFWNPEKYEDKPVTLFSYIADFIEQSEQAINPKTGRPLHYRIKRDYIRTFELLKEFATLQKKEPDFKDIDLDFYGDFVSWLQKKNIGSKDEPKYFSANSVGKFIKNLKVFLNKATEEGINENMAYKSHRFVKIQVEVDNIALTEEELKQIGNLDLSGKPYLERVRDLFLVGCWTGLRFGDLTSITPDKIQDGFISITQSKTGDRVVIPVHPVVTSILNKYGGMLPLAISNQKSNEYIKEVAKLAGLNAPVWQTEIRGGIKRNVKRERWELVKTHTARRSFATNLYKSGVPAHTVMKITGHKSESAFMKYLKLSPDEHAKIVRDHWANNGGHLQIV
jgi:integrase